MSRWTVIRDCSFIMGLDGVVDFDQVTRENMMQPTSMWTYLTLHPFLVHAELCKRKTNNICISSLHPSFPHPTPADTWIHEIYGHFTHCLGVHVYLSGSDCGLYVVCITHFMCQHYLQGQKTSSLEDTVTPAAVAHQRTALTDLIHKLAQRWHLVVPY